MKSKKLRWNEFCGGGQFATGQGTTDDWVISEITDDGQYELIPPGNPLPKGEEPALPHRSRAVFTGTLAECKQRAQELEDRKNEQASA